jgi:hypothetical protein
MGITTFERSTEFFLVSLGVFVDDVWHILAWSSMIFASIYESCIFVLGIAGGFN